MTLCWPHKSVSLRRSPKEAKSPAESVDGQTVLFQPKTRSVLLAVSFTIALLVWLINLKGRSDPESVWFVSFVTMDFSVPQTRLKALPNFFKLFYFCSKRELHSLFFFYIVVKSHLIIEEHFSEMLFRTVQVSHDDFRSLHQTTKNKL